MMILKNTILWVIFLVVAEGPGMPEPLNACDDQVLRVVIRNIDSPKGWIRLAVFDRESGFPEGGTGILEREISISSCEQVEVDIAGLPYGHYAVAVFHDLNGNKKLDKNLLGIPAEPYGFSNNPKVKWRAPKLSEALYDFNAEGDKLLIELRRWSKH